MDGTQATPQDRVKRPVADIDGYARNIIQYGLAIAGVILVATAIVVLAQSRSFARLTQERAEHIQLIARVQLLLSLVKDAETACRGYLLTGKDPYLDPYREASRDLSGIELKLKEADEAGQLQPGVWKDVQRMVHERLNACEHMVDLRHTAPIDSAQMVALLDEGKNGMDLLRERVGAVIEEESSHLRALERETAEKEFVTLSLIGGGFIISASIFIVASLVLLVQIRRRASAEESAAAATARLKDMINELNLRNDQIKRFGELSHSLQSSVSPVEALKLLAETMPSIFAGTRGALFLTKESRDHLETGAVWGEGFHAPPIIGPQDCWALRKGKIHRSRPGDKTFRCPHIEEDPQGISLCVPLLAHGETRGVIQLEYPERDELLPSEEESADACAEQVIMALTNLQLRDRLRTQATRDPLSGLFNRRYVLETAERELYRASRQQQSPIAFVMIDIDHFKRFNDTHGHDAGDHVIQVLAEQLRRFARGSDIVARYGGEEFILVLLDARKEDAVARLREFGAHVRLVSVSHQGATLGNITLSMGVANYPEDGETVDGLIKAADMALYAAKTGGRDQVVAAPGIRQSNGAAAQPAEGAANTQPT